MSTEFESIIRPFQTNQTSPAQTYYTPGQIGVPNVILRLGRSGKGKVMTGSYQHNTSFYCVKYENEADKHPGGSDT